MAAECQKGTPSALPQKTAVLSLPVSARMMGLIVNPCFISFFCKVMLAVTGAHIGTGRRGIESTPPLLLFPCRYQPNLKKSRSKTKHFAKLLSVVMKFFFHSFRDGRVLVTYGGKEGGGGNTGKGGGTLGVHKQQNQRGQDEEEPSVKFVMLNPSVHFDEIVQKVFVRVFHATRNRRCVSLPFPSLSQLMTFYSERNP